MFDPIIHQTILSPTLVLEFPILPSLYHTSIITTVHDSLSLEWPPENTIGYLSPELNIYYFGVAAMGRETDEFYARHYLPIHVTKVCYPYFAVDTILSFSRYVHFRKAIYYEMLGNTMTGLAFNVKNPARLYETSSIFNAA